MMAVNVNANGANTELKKKIFQSFVRLAAKKKKKNKKVSQKTKTIKKCLIAKEFVNKKT